MRPVALQRLTIRTPHGNAMQLDCRADTNDGAVSKSIEERDEYGLVGQHFSGLAIDVGAYIGTVGIGLALDNPGLRVVCVEPVPENVEMIRMNVALNGVASRVSVIEAAASAIDDPVTIKYDFHDVDGQPADYVRDVRMMAGIYRYDDERMQYSTLQVSGISLGTLAKERIALLKIDCEGCEWAFLTSPAIDQVDTIVGEFHHGPGDTDLLDELLTPTHDLEILRHDAYGFGIFRGVRR